jgi:hypothetical protein
MQFFEAPYFSLINPLSTSPNNAVQNGNIAVLKVIGWVAAFPTFLITLPSMVLPTHSFAD